MAVQNELIIGKYNNQDSMKDNLQIVLIVIVFAFAGFRLYQKYYKKDGVKPGETRKSGSSFSSSSKDDEYEPYSKK
jgi:hypothetical protein